MFPSYHSLTVRTVDDAIAVVAFNRPDAANALSTAMALDLKSFFTILSQPAYHVRAIILTGEGKHFCAGADLKERKNMSEEQWLAQHHAFEEALHALLACPLPVIAAVNGAAFGGGLELALACDFIYAAATARFALTEVTLGIMPGMGGTQHLPRLVGAARAKEAIFTGAPFSAGDALAWGMVNKICAGEMLMDEALASAKTIAANAPLAVQAVKKSINQGIAMPMEDALQCELTHYGTLLETKDRHEGIRAFNEKRKAAFTGE